MESGERELYNNVSLMRFVLPYWWQISGLASFLPWLVMFFDVIYADMKFSKGMSLILA
jgi:hypothetical protein